MFEREHHIRIATILQALDAGVLDQHGCLFGGGTAIVLSHGEYRESMDVDFLISDRPGYQANSDRWADDAVFSRDLIDLAMLCLPRPSLTLAIEKAAAAYGKSVERDLAKAIRTLGERKERLEECMTALKIDGVPKALLWKRIRDLKLKK